MISSHKRYLHVQGYLQNSNENVSAESLVATYCFSAGSTAVCNLAQKCYKICTTEHNIPIVVGVENDCSCEPWTWSSTSRSKTIALWYDSKEIPRIAFQSLLYHAHSVIPTRGSICYCFRQCSIRLSVLSANATSSSPLPIIFLQTSANIGSVALVVI